MGISTIQSLNQKPAFLLIQIRTLNLHLKSSTIMASNTFPNPSLLPEIGPDGLPREAPVIAYTEKVCFSLHLPFFLYCILHELQNMNVSWSLGR